MIRSFFALAYPRPVLRPRRHQGILRRQWSGPSRPVPRGEVQWVGGPVERKSKIQGACACACVCACRVPRERLVGQGGSLLPLLSTMPLLPLHELICTHAHARTHARSRMRATWSSTTGGASPSSPRPTTATRWATRCVCGLVCKRHVCIIQVVGCAARCAWACMHGLACVCPLLLTIAVTCYMPYRTPHHTTPQYAAIPPHYTASRHHAAMLPTLPRFREPSSRSSMIASQNSPR